QCKRVLVQPQTADFDAVARSDGDRLWPRSCARRREAADVRHQLPDLLVAEAGERRHLASGHAGANGVEQVRVRAAVCERGAVQRWPAIALTCGTVTRLARLIVETAPCDRRRRIVRKRITNRVSLRPERECRNHEPHRLLPAMGGGATQFDRLETSVAPVHDEHAEALLHAHLDVAGICWISARDVKLLARGQHLLNRVLPRVGVEDALAGGARRRKYPAQRAGAGPQDADAFHLRDLAYVLQAFFAFDDRPVDQLALGVERPQIGFLPVLLLAHAPDRRRDPHIVWSRAALRLES